MAKNGTSTDAIKVVIGLDLGTEYMSAYACYSSLEGEMIDLQAHGAVLLAKKAGQRDTAEDEVDYLRDARGEKSPWLRTRIGIANGIARPPLGAEHARLKFFQRGPKGELFRSEEYDRCPFRFFFRKPAGAGAFQRRLIGSLKDLFMAGALSPVPEVQAPGKPLEFVRFDAEETAAVNIALIINNLVLQSPQIAARGIRPEQALLVLTIPNTFPQAAAERIVASLRGWVACRLDWCWESDALAHFLLIDEGLLPKDENGEPIALQDPGFRAFRERFQGAGLPRQLAALDVGDGTADWGIYNFDSGDDGVALCERLGITGKPIGGKLVTRAFAEYLESRLQDAMDELVRAGVEELARVPLSFLKEVRDWEQQGCCTLHLEAGIDAVKKRVTEDYAIPPAGRLEAAPHFAAAARLLLERIQRELPDLPETQREALRARLEGVFQLPESLPRPASASGVSGLGRRIRNWLAVEEDALGPESDADALQLAQKLRQAVAEGADNLAAALLDGACEREGAEGARDPGELLARAPTSVLVAGQAAQFAPLRKALREVWAQHWGIPEEHIHCLAGAQAKEAGCIGAVARHISRTRSTRGNWLHGSYGFLNLAPLAKDQAFVPCDMGRLAAPGGKDEVRIPSANGAGRENPEGSYALIFSAVPPGWDSPPRLGDGNTVPVAVVTTPPFTVDHLAEGSRLRVLNAGGEETIVDSVTYGQARDKRGAIPWPRLWPEVLPPWR